MQLDAQLNLTKENLVGASAAGVLTLLSLVLEVSNQLEEGHGLSGQGLGDGLVSLDHRSLDVSMRALAASKVSLDMLLGLLVSASGLLADELALGAGAESGLLALPVALGLLAHRGALGLGGSAGSTALSRSADSLALGAVSRLAEILGATNVALRLVAVDLACSARGLLAVHLALWSLAHRVAHSRARRIIALPSALRVALLGGLLEIGIDLNGEDRAQHQEGEHSEKDVRNLHL